jgi:hypothetical protein
MPRKSAGDAPLPLSSGYICAVAIELTGNLLQEVPRFGSFGEHPNRF